MVTTARVAMQSTGSAHAGGPHAASQHTASPHAASIISSQILQREARRAATMLPAMVVSTSDSSILSFIHALSAFVILAFGSRPNRNDLTWLIMTHFCLFAKRIVGEKYHLLYLVMLDPRMTIGLNYPWMARLYVKQEALTHTDTSACTLPKGVWQVTAPVPNVPITAPLVAPDTHLRRLLLATIMMYRRRNTLDAEWLKIVIVHELAMLLTHLQIDWTEPTSISFTSLFAVAVGVPLLIVPEQMLVTAVNRPETDPNPWRPDT